MKENIRAWLKLLILLADEALVLFTVLFISWKMGLNLPIAALVVIAVVVAAIVFWLHWILLTELKEGLIPSHNNMIGLKGKVIRRLCPEGVVKVRGELWKTVAENSDIEVGQQVTVVGREGLVLHVE